ncbi:MAG TPA: MmgE/PrpD family protein [Candidatus Binatia bacterium]
MTEASFSEKIAREVSALQLTDIPEAVVTAAKLHLLDSIGCILAGSRLEPGKLAYEMVAMRNDLTPGIVLLGTHARAAYLDAAQAMSVAAHCGEMDDIHSASGVCIGAMVVPALLSLAQKFGGNGRRFLEALIAGYEVTTRVGLAIDGASLFARGGWWPSTVCGGFGVAVAGAKFLGWAADKMVNAIGIASLHAGGMLTGGHEGATARHLVFGRAAENGLLSLAAVEQGFTGPKRAFEDPRGFCLTLCSEPRWEYLEPGADYFLPDVAFKPYPCARQLHAGVECLLRIMEQHAVSFPSIESIELELPTPIASMFDRRGSVTNRAALLGSGQFVMAVTAYRGRIDLDSFSDEFVTNDAIRSLSGRVIVKPEREMDRHFPRYWPARVTIRSSKRAWTDEVIIPKGERGNPMSLSQIQSKFLPLAAPVIGRVRCVKTFLQIEDLEVAESLEPLVSDLALSR